MSLRILGIGEILWDVLPDGRPRCPDAARASYRIDFFCTVCDNSG